jgi:hypothetical protein|tara:strand:+ start:480 stop:638 length:159 start_codon:yes stop_codon:yes gene_type:complete
MYLAIELKAEIAKSKHRDIIKQVCERYGLHKSKASVVILARTAVDPFELKPK